MNPELINFLYKNANWVYYTLCIVAMCYTFFKFLVHFYEKTNLHHKIHLIFELISEVPTAIKEIKNGQIELSSQLKLHNNIVTTILDTLELAQFLCDSDGKCISVNSHWVNLTGLTEKEAMGSNWLLSVHPNDRDEIKQKWHDLIENSSPFEEVFRYQHRITHQITKVKCTAKEIKNDNNERLFVIGLSKVIK